MPAEPQTTTASAADLVTLQDACRVCAGGNLVPVLNLGAQHLQGSFIKEGFPDPPLERFPLEQVRCDIAQGGCGLVQLRHTVHPDVLYRDYWYRSGINAMMRDHLQWITEAAEETLGRRPSRVLDIGCNDGTLLGYYRDVERWGVEPSNAADDADVDLRVVRDFFPSSDPKLVAGSFDIVTAIAMFYDTADPVAFCRRAAELLVDDGVLVIEVADYRALIELTAYDTICHEHVSYFSLTTLDAAFSRAGLEIVRVDLNETNGGSICCFLRKQGAAPPPDRFREQLEAAWDLETSAAMAESKPYEDFAARVERHRSELQALIRDIRGDGKTIHAYGASTKGNTLLQFCGLDRSVIPYAAERNPMKFGARTVGTDIEIISEAESRSKKPDYYLVLPWHFRPEILEREAETIRGGIRLIFPLPAVEVVGDDAS